MWQQAAPGRWTVPEGTDIGEGKRGRHVLAHIGDLLVELHWRTVHVYRAGEIDPADPLVAATWLRTVGEVDAPSGDDVWSTLDRVAAQDLPAAAGPVA